MSTKKELAATYAAEIRDAVGHTKLAKADAAARSKDLREALNGVFQKLDGITYEDSDERITDADKADLLSLVDSALGLGRGKMAMLKKGSVESLIAYDQMLSELLQALMPTK